MNERWKSRKFLTTLAAQIAAIAVLIWPDSADSIVAGVESVTALIVVSLTALGYVHAEASVDRARSSAEPPGPEDEA